ncbi:DUF3862 domain-containing protein [Hathewaya histolytica]|uniref:DUF3862 domain-containing protein n=1 Tax=Hathewaya histolytica TaxID=1498 RepID=UPI003B6804D5
MKKPIYKKWWFWLVVILFIGGIGNALNKGDDPKKVGKSSTTVSKTENKDKKEKSKPKEEEKEKTKVNYENFLKVKMGMKYEDVVKIIGEGKQSSSSEVSGVKISLYSWHGDGISNMNITIKDGVVSGKAQMGLQKNKADVNIDKFNKVKEGMTYEEVKEVLGEGQLTSQSKIMNIETMIYSWINKDGSNMNCTFSGNKMKMKAQFNLK